jgi:hypothetical protein
VQNNERPLTLNIRPGEEPLNLQAYEKAGGYQGLRKALGMTPKDVQGYAAFTNKEGLMVAATSLALQWSLQKAIHKYEEAKTEHEKEAARREVQDALADLEKARIKAGLPPK